MHLFKSLSESLHDVQQRRRKSTFISWPPGVVAASGFSLGPKTYIVFGNSREKTLTETTGSQGLRDEGEQRLAITIRYSSIECQIK